METIKRILRFILISLVCIILAAALVWYFLIPKLYPLQVNVTQQSSGTSSKLIEVSGTMSLPGEVDLIVNNVSVNSVATGSDGRYVFGNIMLSPGGNRIEVKARALKFLRKLHAEASTDVFVPFTPPVIPQLAPLPEVTNEIPITISGTATPQTKVFLAINDSPPVQLYSDAAGLFYYPLDIPMPGDYKVTAWSENSDGQASPKTPELRFRYDPDWRLPLAVVMKRELTADIAYKSFSLRLKTVLPKNDYRAVSLIKGMTQLTDFIDGVYGKMMVKYGQPDGIDVVELFRDSTPEISIDGDSVTVSASSRAKIQVPLPVLSGVVEFYTGNVFMTDINDIFTVNVFDYSPKFFDPRPSILNGSSATWYGGKREEGLAGGIATKLDYEPFESFTNAFRLFRLTPYDLIPYPINVVFGLVYGILLLIPLTWTLWILHKQPREALENRRFAFWLKLLATLLMAFCFVVPLLELSYALQYAESFRLMGNFEGLYSPAFYLLILLCMFLLAGALQVTAKIFWPPSLSFWTQSFFKAVWLSAIVSIYIVTVLWWVAYDWPNLQPYYRYLTAVVTPVLAIPLVVLTLLYKSQIKTEGKADEPRAEGADADSEKGADEGARAGAGAREPKSRARLGVKWSVIVVALLLISFIYIVSGSMNDTPEYSKAPVTGLNIFYFSLWKSQLTFTFAQDLIPFLLLIGILPLLKHIRAGALRKGSLIYSVGELLFVVYVVGTTEYWFMIPIPLFLALWVYRRYLFMPEEKRARVDACAAEVAQLRDEKRVLELVKASEEAGMFQSVLGRLKKRLTDGEISVAFYERRKEEARAWLDVYQQKSTLKCGMKIADAVLAFGPCRTNWANGWQAVKYGAVLTLPLFIVYLAVFLRGQAWWVPKIFMSFWVFNQFFTYFADWLIVAFFFGYFFNYFAGESGLKKGVYFAIAYVGCLLPVWAISLSSSIPTLIIVLVQNFLFPPLVGLLAFDYRNYRDTWGSQFRWKQFAQFGDMPSFTALASVALTGLSLVVSSLVTGQYKEIINLIMKTALPQVTGQSPH